MSYSLETSFNSLPPRGHPQGQTRDNSNTRFFHTKKEHIDMCSYIISVVTMSFHILFEGFCFVLSYPTHIWIAYVAEIFLEIKNAKTALYAGCQIPSNRLPHVEGVGV